MLYEDEIKTVQKSVRVNEQVLERNIRLLELHNRIADQIEAPRADIKTYVKSAYEKGLDAGTVARGSRLLQTNYRNQPSSIAPLGNVLEEAGAEILRNQPGTELQFFSHYGGTGSGYLPLATNASATYAGLTEVINDQPGTIYNERASMTGYIVETFIRKSILRGFMGDPDQIINLYTSDFERRDDLLLDELGLDSVALNPAIAGSPLSTTVPATTGDLIQTFIDIRATLKARGVTRVDLHLSPAGHAKFISQRVATTGAYYLFNVGNGQTAQYTPIRNADGSDKEVGLVGVFDGSRVYINNGVRNTYTVTGNNITATTGDTKTAMFVGDSRFIGAGTGIEEYNETQVITTDPAAIRKGAVLIFRNIVAGAQVINPQAFGYAAFSV